MRIPIFGSCPTRLSMEQEKVRRYFLGELDRVQLEWRSIGRTDYPNKNPMREVLGLARHCSGGLILGFSQFETKKGIWKKGTPDQVKQIKVIKFPTPWNQIEAGILFALDLPLLVFRDDDVAGGVFDNGVTDLFVQKMPTSKSLKLHKKAIREVIRKWSLDVCNHYYRGSNS